MYQRCWLEVFVFQVTTGVLLTLILYLKLDLKVQPPFLEPGWENTSFTDLFFKRGVNLIIQKKLL